MRIVQQTLDELNVETHPDKTSIGRIDWGFRFLGYDFNTTGLVGVAPTTYERFDKRVNRLYEQGASARCIGDYVRRWYRWLVSELGDRIMTATVAASRFRRKRDPFNPTAPIPSNLSNDGAGTTAPRTTIKSLIACYAGGSPSRGQPPSLLPYDGFADSL